MAEPAPHYAPSGRKLNRRIIKGQGLSTVTQRVGSAQLDTVSSADELAARLSLGAHESQKEAGKQSSRNLLMSISTFEALNRVAKPVGPVTSHEARPGDGRDDKPLRS